VELFRRHALQRSKRGHAGVIHQHIHLPVLLLDLRERSRDLLGFREVTLHRLRLPAALHNRRHHPVRPLAARRIVHDHSRTLSAQIFRNASANALRSARNQRNFSRKPAHILFSVVVEHAARGTMMALAMRYEDTTHVLS
jgi:hypothetical protein